MKISEFKKLIREEVRNVMKEGKTWDKNQILKFFKRLKLDHGMTAKPQFKTDTTGYVEILMGGPGFDANFMVDGRTLVLKPDSTSDMSAKDFLADIEADNAKNGKPNQYKYEIKGKLVIVS
jgi:hypothetical protein